MDLNGKILEMKISTEIRDGSWNDEMEAASKRNFLGKSLKGLIGRDLGVARSLRGSPRSEFCSNFKSFDRLGWLRGLELRCFTGF